MIIDLSKPRESYFDDPTPTDVVRKVWTPEEGEVNFSIPRDLPKLDENKQIQIGTKEADLENLLSEEHQIDSLSLVDKIDALSKVQLLILPKEYRITADDAREAVVYSQDSLVKLDSVAVIRKILGPNEKRGRLSVTRKKAEQWHPEKVIKAAFDLLHENQQDNIDRTISSYAWFGKDRHRRIVSLYRAVQGAELRAFQNFVAFKKLIPVWRKEVRRGKKAQSGYKIPLNADQINNRKRKIRRYENYLKRMRKEGQPASRYLNRLDVDFTDLIEPIPRRGEGRAETFAFRSGRLMRVPSRSKKEQDFYKIKYTSVPLVIPNGLSAYSMVWDLRATCPCNDSLYRSDRRKTSQSKGEDEDFFDAHGIAGMHTLFRIAEDGYKRGTSNRTIPFQPFVLPTASMMQYVEKLRNQTLIVEKNPETGKWHKHALNHTEIENLMWKRVTAYGYEENFTTDKKVLMQNGYDPHTDLITFKI